MRLKKMGETGNEYLISADQHMSQFQNSFELDKMAGMAGELPSNTPLSFDFPDARVDDDVSHRMRIPQKITVPGDEEESHPNAARSGDGIGSMSIPERIEIVGSFSPNSEIPRDLRDDVVGVSSMSSMLTPPRTLTVDDTKSAYYPQRAAAGSPARGNRRANIARDIDDESIAVGLEVIEEGTPLDSDSDVGHYMGNDMSDTRKCVLQIQQLNRRVRDLERNVDQNSVGFWSKLAFFTFTIINPMILHWLFWKRR